MKVYLTSAYDEDRWALRNFQRMADADRYQKHELCFDPEYADIIFFVEHSHYDDDMYYSKLRNHEYVRKYRKKCFMHNAQDRPWLVLPGIYASMPKAFYDPRYVRAGSYITDVNPLFDEYNGCDIAPKLLFSFMGRASHKVRNKIFKLKHEAAYIEDTSSFKSFFTKAEDDDSQFRKYIEVMLNSMFILCPAGSGTSSIRLFETMRIGRVPIILSDQYVFPEGPEWHRFSIQIPERQVHAIPEVLEEYAPRWEKMSTEAHRNWREWFAPDVLFHHNMEQCASILASRPHRNIYEIFPDRSRLNNYYCRAPIVWSKRRVKQVLVPWQR